MNTLHQMLQILRRARLHRFVLVGALNTLVGYICILTLQAINHSPILSNLLGYGLNAGLSYLTHSRLTFSHSPTPRSAAAYVCVLLAGYSVNLVVLNASLHFISPIAAQALAVLSFAIVSYLGQRYWVFPQKQRQRPGEADALG